MGTQDIKVIGLTGAFGSGCNTASRFFKTKGFQVYSLSKWLKKTCDNKGLFKTRRNLQDIGDEIRMKYPSSVGNESRYDYLVQIFLSEISQRRKLTVKKINDGRVKDLFMNAEILKSSLNIDKNLVIKSIRNKGETDTLRDIFPNFYLIAIDTESGLRWNRIIGDNKVKKEYNNKKYFDIDDERDSGEDEEEYGQQVRRCVNEADIIINNDSNLEKFHKSLDEYYRLIIGELKREESDPEKAMREAVTISHRSKCFKRQVGAVLVDIDTNEIVSLGYNEGPLEKDICFKSGKCTRSTKQICHKCGQKWSVVFDKCMGCNEPIPKDIRSVLKKNLDLCIAVHAEERAILNALKVNKFKQEKKYALYTTTFPCLICTRTIIEVGIKKIIYIDPYPYFDAQKLLSDKSLERIDVIKFTGVKSISAYEKLFKG